jgi:hypothetical protein
MITGIITVPLPWTLVSKEKSMQIGYTTMDWINGKAGIARLALIDFLSMTNLKFGVESAKMIS